MELGKRKPIRLRVHRIVMGIAVTATLIACAVGFVSMVAIRGISEEALLNNTKQNVGNLVESKAELAEAQFGAYQDTVQRFADYIGDLYAHPENYVKREVLPPNKANAGKLVLQRGLVSEAVSAEELADEIGLLSNLEQIFRPVMTENSAITTIYVSTKSGVMVAYDADSALSANDDGSEIYFNFRETEYYRAGMATDRPFFTAVYADSYGRGMMISCAAPFRGASGTNGGVVCMDILIADLYDDVVRLDMGEGAYAFLVDTMGNMMTPAATGLSIFQNSELNDAVRGGILGRQSGVEQTESGAYYAFAPVPSVSWEFCIRVPQSMILKPVREIESNITQAMLTYLGVIVAVLLAVTLVVGRFSVSLTSPLIELGNDAKEISGGNLDYRAAVRGNDEIGDLARSFNDMAASLKQYIADLTQVTAEKERIGAELNVATQIQADMLPRIFPAFPERREFDIYATMTPAKEVGGDFYDFFLVDDDHLAMVMADVSGKGVPAALFMVIAKTLIKNRAQMGGTPSEILADVNDQLCEGNEAGLFVTVWLGILEISTGKGMAANAGHEHPAIRRGNGAFEMVKYRHSPALATMEGIPFREHEFELKPGDALYVYTDGVAEATNAENVLFGEERTVEALNRSSVAPPQTILENVKQAIDEFVGDAVQFDDITMLCLDYFGPGKEGV